MNLNILRFASLGSTNTEALERARKGAAEGLCVIAAEQTAGRGRQGRKWTSEKESGLNLSLVLRPQLDTRLLSLITLMAGVAVHDTLKEFGVAPDIKWVNDVLAGEKKISGILAETTDTVAGLAVIVGIGINLSSRNFPAELADIATSIEDQTGVEVDASETAEVLTTYLAYFYDILSGIGGPAEIVGHWQRRSTFFSGRQVRVTLSNGSFEGETCGLEENGALRVKSSDGTVTVVQAGDVERIRSQTKSSK